MRRIIAILLVIFSFATAQGQSSPFLQYHFYDIGSSAGQLEQRAAFFFRWNHKYHHYNEFVWVRAGNHVGDWVKTRNIGPVQSRKKTFDVSYGYYLSIFCENGCYTVSIEQFRVTAKRKNSYLLSGEPVLYSQIEPRRYNRDQIACFEAAKDALNEEVNTTLLPLLQKYMKEDDVQPNW